MKKDGVAVRWDEWCMFNGDSGVEWTEGLKDIVVGTAGVILGLGGWVVVRQEEHACGPWVWWVSVLQLRRGECSCYQTSVLGVNSLFKPRGSRRWKLCQGLNVCVFHFSVGLCSLPPSLSFHLPLLKAWSETYIQNWQKNNLGGEATHIV